MHSYTYRQICLYGSRSCLTRERVFSANPRRLQFVDLLPLTPSPYGWSLCSAATTTSVVRSCTTELSSPLAGMPYIFRPHRRVTNSFESCLLYAVCRHHRSVEIAKRAQKLSSMWLRAAQPRRCGRGWPQSLRRLQDKRAERSQSCYHHGVCKS